MTTVISPNMGLPVPVVSSEPGPDWANDINACMSAIDSHDHATGSGVQVTPDGININADLPFNGHNGTTYRSVRFTAQSAPLAVATDVGCLYESGVDLYYNDGSGNQVRITQSGSVTGATGTITGLPSGTASASFAAATFTFRSATSTPATMNIGPIVTGAASASPKTVTISASGAQPSNYSMTWPLALGSVSENFLTSDASGNMTWATGNGLLPLGSIIATFPSLSGAYVTGATTSASSQGFVLCHGQTISDGTSPMNGVVVPNINAGIFIRGNTTSGTTGGQTTVTLITANLASHTHAFTSTTSVADSTHLHNMRHNHQWGYLGTAVSLNTQTTNSGTQAAYTSATAITQGLTATGGTVNYLGGNAITGGLYTTGVLNDIGGSGTTNPTTGGPTGTTTVSGTTNSSGSATPFSILPDYIEAVYLMRIK